MKLIPVILFCWALLPGGVASFCINSAAATGLSALPVNEPAKPPLPGDSWPRPLQIWHFFNPFEEPSLLVAPDAPPSLLIAKNHPRLDGATSLLPVYAAAFKALYRPPGEEEGEEALKAFKLSINCSSSRGFASFLKKESDIFFGFEPSEELKRLAEEAGQRLRLVPLGKDGFVFCVNVDNPVNGLSLDEVRGIYSGAITNWQELGGPDKAILPYQRVHSSGSQTALQRHVMKDRPLMKPPLKSIVSMLDLLDDIANARQGEMPIGYSFRWYVREMAKVEGIKLLTLNGVEPDAAAIGSGRYPLVVPFFAIVREGDVSPETQKVIDWFAGPEGQALIEKTGYLPNAPAGR